MGDFKLSPAYDLLNSRIHIDDKDFALDDGLLPRDLAQGKIIEQIATLSRKAGISEIVFNEILSTMLSHPQLVEKLIFSSFLNEKIKKNYWQSYQGRLKQLMK